MSKSSYFVTVNTQSVRERECRKISTFLSGARDLPYNITISAILREREMQRGSALLKKSKTHRLDVRLPTHDIHTYVIEVSEKDF